MLIPNFSIRALLWLTLACSVPFLCFGFAARGAAWAIGASAGLATLGGAFVIYALVYSAAIWLAQAGGTELKAPRSPFAEDEAPPQIVPPKNADW